MLKLLKADKMLPLSNILEKLNPLDKHAPPPAEYFLSLTIGEKKVKSAIWWFSGQKIVDLNFGATESWGGETTEDLIIAADASIASAITQLTSLEGSQPSKVILGLPEHWVSENSIIREKLPLLQGMCKKLQLKPLGFVVTPEAVAHYLKIEEGGLPSAILVNLGEADIIVSLIIKGKFLGSKVVGRSDSLVLDLEEGLLRFGYQDVLPSRILLLEDIALENIEELKRSLVAYPWVGPDKKLNFLQLPKVEVIDTNFEASAVVVAGCKELGLGIKGEVAEVKDFQKEEPSQRPAFVAEVSDFAPQSVEEKIEEETEAVGEDPVEDFGFVVGKDILEIQPQMLEPKIETVQIVGTEAVDDVVAVVPQQNKRSLKLPDFKKFLTFFKRLKLPATSFKRPSLSRVAFDFSFNKRIFLVAGFLVVILTGFSFAFWAWTRAEIKIFVQPLKIDKEFYFTVSTKEDLVDSGKMVVPARITEVEIVGEKSASVTGKKTVGEKATGEVVIYNRTEQSRSLPKGSILKGPGGLKFLLNDEVKVASKTADLVNGVDRWGETKVGIIAAEIGAQYNIDADSALSFETVSSSSLLVKNSTAFSGGTSREIQAVSKEDREQLQKALMAELQKRAEIEVQEGLSVNDHLLPDSIMLQNKTDHFSHEVGDEADNLSLQTKADFVAQLIKDEDFQTLVREIVFKDLPGEYQNRPTKGESDFFLKDKKKAIFTAQVKQDFLPKLELGSLPKKLRGKRVSKAEEILKSANPQALGLQILINPKMFAVLKILPPKQQNINIIIEML